MACALVGGMTPYVTCGKEEISNLAKFFLKKYLRSRGRFRIVFPRAEAQTGIEKLGCRLMAGQRILVPSMGVRLPPSQPFACLA